MARATELAELRAAGKLLKVGMYDIPKTLRRFKAEVEDMKRRTEKRAP